MRHHVPLFQVLEMLQGSTLAVPSFWIHTPSGAFT